MWTREARTLDLLTASLLDNVRNNPLITDLIYGDLATTYKYFLPPRSRIRKHVHIWLNIFARRYL